MSALRTSAGSGLHLRAAHEVVALLKAKEVTPEQLIDVAQQRIEATESAVAATPITCFERARSMARSLPKDEGQRGFLHGLPVLIKDDTHPVAGVRFTEGSKLFEHRVAEQSAEVVRRLEAKGALVLGKTNVPEFCAGSQSFNSLFPTSRSPWHLASTAGGSSGGSGAALAAGQAWLATGTDLGGSLRIPAAFCGVVGFRVSPGLIGREAPGPSGPRNALHAITGPMARNVRDCGLLLDAMAGGAGWDFECPQPEEGFEAAAVRGASASAKLRVGFSTLGCRFAPAVERRCAALRRIGWGLWWRSPGRSWAPRKRWRRLGPSGPRPSRRLMGT
ncbi:unnamed protein product [Effrenium voratum]|nr:unnamed protein product [Effrenium voratum]